MSSIMTSGEMAQMYRNAADRKKQIEILADLSLRTKLDVALRLIDAGENVPEAWVTEYDREERYVRPPRVRPAPRFGEWTSSAVRKPHKDHQVLCYYMTQRPGQRAFGAMDRGQWTGSSWRVAGVTGVRVEAWTPLPPPPSAEVTG